MSESDLRQDLSALKQEVDQSLDQLLSHETDVPQRLMDAMRHSLVGGGKRLRPALLLWAYEALRTDAAPVTRDQAMVAACAVEMLHTYSLIHDDLPAMDDDVLRRGRPTCHVAFDEATAILAGDGLQALGFAKLAESGGPVAGELVAMVARAVGPSGMVGGQQDDLDAENGVEVSAAQVEKIHLGKTAQLLAVAMTAGALLAGSTKATRESIEAAGLDIGLAFQGADDILDVTATTEQMGKSVGKDQTAGKATWVAVEGLDEAKRRTEKLGERGLRLLEALLPMSDDGRRLLGLNRLMWNRDR